MVKHVIAYFHTHWDREWYREFETFRIRLLSVFDNVLDMLSQNKIPSFYFDGQVCALEDYLEIRPEKRELVEKLVQQKKLFIGPFYCLIDEFLTNKTCFMKNIEIGVKIAKKYGCNDFIGYLPDTFGHSMNVPEILMEYGIDKCIVWRGCSNDIPAEFKWCGINTVNLVRGYFNDVFSMNTDIETKAAVLKHNLDLIAEKSGDILFLPIGADHLGLESDIFHQIKEVNELLSDYYEILPGSPFDYFNAVEDRFNNFEWNNELRDNSNTFTLQGCYSSRLDLKKKNIECSHLLELAAKFVKQQNEEEKYATLLEHAYKLLLQNQAHDSICGCSTDDVHAEDLIKYKKIAQIAHGIIDELKLKNKFEDKKIINLSKRSFSGIVEFESSDFLEGYDKVSDRKGFVYELLADTQRIPITEDYTTINKYLAQVENIKPNEVEFLMPAVSESDIIITENSIENKNLGLKIIDKDVYINGIKLSLKDYNDLGDSYNHAPDVNDRGSGFNLIKSKIVMNNSTRAVLRLDFEGKWDIISLFAAMDKNSKYLKLDFEWDNSRKNHILYTEFELNSPICEVFSEDMNSLIKRSFNPEYNIRENMPNKKGIEVKNNTAPMQRGLLIDEENNNIGIITKGLTQYEIYNNKLMIPILRATGRISEPLNPARTTPAGPPIECEALQMSGHNSAELYVFFGNEKTFNSVMNQVYCYVIT